ncbi:4-(cytidine 5'-diphospho)-2-C-methyl-D-erythritol kinase [Novispirillum sp. DQ9]|uniref:4-(cytidine 5'-diphospho)-2-C-methyl-D-erythritol kinase n=1 Tax=Novispirillum sp. DQ9 TaxID=3398612 RepID=UPI003C7DD755
MSGGGVAVLAPAKVNLTLHVTGRRDDGYHLLDSLVVFAGIHDRVTVEPGEGGLSLTVTGPYAGFLAGSVADEDNIVLRAARALAAATGVPANAHVTLDKALPVAAGIGGGSADAAAALRGLCRLWGVSLPAAEMYALAARLGADVPVCLRGRATLVAGVGETLSDAPPLPAAWLVLANPGVPLSTPAVFKARSGAFSDPAPLQDAPRDAAALAAALARRRNDLTAAAISLAPEIGTTLAALGAAPGCLLARMSGSGATCWGLFETEYTATSACRALRSAHPTWWTQAAPLLSETAPFNAPQ